MSSYRQRKGTAMGPKNACDYADVAMNNIDQAVHANNPACQQFEIIPTFWGRFRDEEEDLLRFKEWIKTIHPSLKFTFEYSEEGVEFLDLYVYTKENKIHTKLYSTQSDTHSYLVPTSYHKNHIVKNIPFNIARRVQQNNSEQCNYDKDKETYTNYLIERGYKETFIAESFTKFENIDRKEFYTKKDNVIKKQCIPF